MNQRIQKACDGCRIRKVKCTGTRPCGQCNHLNLLCKFSVAKGHRLPPVRGRLLAQLRQVGTGASELPIPSSVAEQDNSGRYMTAAKEQQLRPAPHFPEHPYSEDFFTRLLPDYERAAYPVNPIITSNEIAESILHMRTDPTHAALVYAFAAVTINLGQASWPLDGEISARIRDLMWRSLSARHQADPDDALREMPNSVRRIMTCIFLEICMMAFKRYDRSFTLLREAISMIQMLCIERLCSNSNLDLSAPELARRQRLYWEAFIHERFLTMVSNYPSILPPLRTGMPFEDPTIPLHVHIGFSRIIRLFLIMDDDFLAHWTAQDDPGQARREMTAAWIELKQEELDDDETSAAAETIGIHSGTAVAGLTELQQADLDITRAWLRTAIWQLAMSRCLLSSEPPTSCHEAMSLVFPVRRLSAQLRQLVARLEFKTSIAMHGFGILQKIFEITNTIADVMALVPASIATEKEEGVEHQRMADLLFLVKVLFSFERIDQVQKDIMKMKMENLKKLIPEFDFEGWSELSSYL
ncbi:hypothetical protein BKA61DRAFT_316679 [Leptodontidium sp. MPI-SDFR-AT-0119]|nr:hypothetical protein BKA61DRAFT_316679 [Leptodontidium sp. MPI-SDFR-AT-0119]